MFKFSSSFQPLAHVHRIERNALYPLDIYSSLLEYKNNDRRKDRDIYFYSSRGSIETLTDRIASGKRPRDVFPFTRARVDLDSLSLSFSLSFSPPLFLSSIFLSFIYNISFRLESRSLNVSFTFRELRLMRRNCNCNSYRWKYTKRLLQRTKVKHGARRNACERTEINSPLVE